MTLAGAGQPSASATVAASARPGRFAASAGPPRPTFETAPEGTPSQAPDTVFIDELTWEETRDALKAGTRTAIVPAGGTVNRTDGLVRGQPAGTSVDVKVNAAIAQLCARPRP